MSDSSGNLPIASIIKLTAALALLAGAVMLLMWGGGEPELDIRQAYYFDPQTSQVFVGPASGIAPIPAPSDPAGVLEPTGVRAFIFCCGPCNASYDNMTPEQIKEAGAIIGWLERYTPEGREILMRRNDQRPDTDFETGISNKLVRAVDSDRWYPAESPAANRIRYATRQHCEDGSPNLCTP
ncbi:MAG: hypothetical protein RIG82_09935 [Phycisphaeraceae bacterium]